MQKNILITGGAGYIGSHAVKLFLENGYKVTVFDNFFRGFRQPLEVLGKLGNLKVVEGDLREAEVIEKTIKEGDFDGVLHFAALCLVSESMEKPELYFHNNVMGTFNLLEAMRKNQVNKFIFSSTCAVYGDSQYLPMDENHPTQPLNPYGESKLISEKMINWYGEIHQLDYAIMRYFNVCGSASDGLIGDSKKPSQLLMQNVVRGAMGIEPFVYTCPEVDTPDGTPIRDYIDVEDLVKAHFLAYEKLDLGVSGEIFNLSNGKGYSVNEIVSEVEKNFKIKMEKLKGECRKGEYAQVFAIPQKAQKLLAWQTKKDLLASIESMKKWYQAHPQGWDF